MGFGFGCRAYGITFSKVLRFSIPGLRVEVLGFRAYRFGFRVWGLGFRT